MQPVWNVGGKCKGWDCETFVKMRASKRLWLGVAGCWLATMSISMRQGVADNGGFFSNDCAAVLLGSRLSLLCDVELNSREGVYYMLKKYNTAVMYKAHSRWAMVRERSICEKSVLVPCYCGCLRVYEERRRCPLVRIKHRAARKKWET